ncbi:MAG: hypothetical protein M9954_14055 [Cyclobacteriaceae bacterium]|nr:hypothetical protein [Cyclobacteriaceae bacterium]MCB0499452.1 hypothetical protein [Cyclobacteriaceae bacterium]MCB9236527.1 DUF998 domain-containing protein [Flammeovirgaceae bacterium]MCO5272778.1 hypothetical protein [Cyclobacteriaceae bacterium]MCW5903093.1 hypothetical protein [Cyclobacteriaceae bacterium]
MMDIREVTHYLTRERSDIPEVISFRATRRAIGVLGVALPFLLWWGGLLLNRTALQPSISHYYFTNMREAFVGVLCAVSLFLFTYKGYNKMDSYAANAAGFFSLMVAVFPTNIIDGYPGQSMVASILDVKIHNAIHLTSAGLFFITLACMSLFLFTKSNKPKSQWSDARKSRNMVYKVSGWIMLLCIVLIGISEPLLGVGKTSKVTFAMETVALFFFGISWLTKGDVVFGD